MYAIFLLAVGENFGSIKSDLNCKLPMWNVSFTFLLRWISADHLIIIKTKHQPHIDHLIFEPLII